MSRPGGRLTLTSNTPVTTSNVTNSANLYYTPYVSDEIELYDGSSWVLRTFSQTSITIPNQANKVYDVFAFYNSGAGQVEFETEAWTNDTTRNVSLTRLNGRLVKSGANTRLYVGTFRTTGTAGRISDSETVRFLFNMYNRVTRTLRRQESATSWSYNGTSWRMANNNSANKVEVVVGEPGAVIDLRAVSFAGANGTPNIGIGIDTIANSGLVARIVLQTGGTIIANLASAPSIGFHEFNWVERASSGTMGVDNTANELCGLMGTVQGM